MKNDSLSSNRMAAKEPMRMNNVLDEASMQAVCPRSGEESLLFLISKRKEAEHGRA